MAVIVWQFDLALQSRARITGSQIRAARALIRWTAEDLAGESKVGIATIRRAAGRGANESTYYSSVKVSTCVCKLNCVTRRQSPATVGKSIA
jgi:hypothetical protein